MNYKISHWAKATITTVMDPPDQFYVSFDNETHLSNRLVNRMGAEIAPLNTFTDDFDWRYEIKTNDLFDSLDSEAIWYKSTCLDQRESQIDQFNANEESNDVREVKEVYVGYRIYDEEEGHKVDDDGRKYVGWSNKYDEWVSVTSPTI